MAFVMDGKIFTALIPPAPAPMTISSPTTPSIVPAATNKLLYQGSAVGLWSAVDSILPKC